MLRRTAMMQAAVTAKTTQTIRQGRPKKMKGGSTTTTTSTASGPNYFPSDIHRIKPECTTTPSPPSSDVTVPPPTKEQQQQPSPLVSEPSLAPPPPPSPLPSPQPPIMQASSLLVPAAHGLFLDGAASSFYSSYRPSYVEGRRPPTEMLTLLRDVAKEASYTSPIWLPQDFISYHTSTSSGGGESSGKNDTTNHISSLASYLNLPSASIHAIGGSDSDAHHHNGTYPVNTQQLSDHGAGLLSLGSDRMCLAAVMNTLRCAITGEPLREVYGVDAAAAVARVALDRVLPFLVSPPIKSVVPSLFHPSNSPWMYWAPEVLLQRHYGMRAKCVHNSSSPSWVDFAFMEGSANTPSARKQPFPTHRFLAQCYADPLLSTTQREASSPTVRFICAAATDMRHASHLLAFPAPYAKGMNLKTRVSLCTSWNASQSGPDTWVGVPMSPSLVVDPLCKFLEVRKNNRIASASSRPAVSEFQKRQVEIQSSLNRWCARTYHPDHASDANVRAALTSAQFATSTGPHLSLWSLFGTKREFAALGSPVVGQANTAVSASSHTAKSSISTLVSSSTSPTLRPVQTMDISGGVSNLYCAAVTSQPDRLMYLLKNRF